MTDYPPGASLEPILVVRQRFNLWVDAKDMSRYKVLTVKDLPRLRTQLEANGWHVKQSGDTLDCVGIMATKPERGKIDVRTRKVRIRKD